MMRSSYHSDLFRDGSIGHIFRSKLEGLNAAIDRESENYILNVNENEFTRHLENQFQIDKPVIHFDQLYADIYEGNVPAEYFPFSFAVNRSPRLLIRGSLVQVQQGEQESEAIYEVGFIAAFFICTRFSA